MPAPTPKPAAAKKDAKPAKPAKPAKKDKGSDKAKPASKTKSKGGEPGAMHIATKAAVPAVLLLMFLWGMLRFWRCANGFGATMLKPLIVFVVAFAAVFGTMFAPPFAKYKNALFYSWGFNKDKVTGAQANVNIVLPVMALCIFIVFVPVVWIWTRKCQDFRKLLKLGIPHNNAALNRAHNNAAAHKNA